MKRVLGRPEPLGVSIEEERVNFAVCVPEGSKCELLLYPAGADVPAEVYLMQEKDGIGEVRFLALEGLTERYEYNFRIGGKICIDPYARAITGHKLFGEKEDLESGHIRGKLPVKGYDWEGDQRLNIPFHEIIAYSLHVRGFTKSASSRVKNRGTFAGLVEKLPYLKELGINQIQCMPVYEFVECPEGYQNYWGYGEGCYFAPKAAYAAAQDAVTELKDMVKAFHREGIEVVLEMPFHEGILFQTVLECLKYYLLEYHIDGFVVNPFNAPWESLNKDPLLKGVKLMQKNDWFQNTMRRFLKGDEGMVQEVMWAFRHNSREDGKCNYITAQTGFTLNDMVSYDGKHNEANGERNLDGPEYNYSWNCGAEGPSRKKAVVELRRHQIRNAFFLLLMAQGTPCLLAGDEFANTQKGNNNVYCQDNETSWLNWGKIKSQGELLDYVKELIAFRKKHPVFHRAELLLGMDQTACGIPDVSYHGEDAWQAPSEIASRQLGIFYCGSGMKDDECFVAYNMHWLTHSFALPTLGKNKKWYQVIETAQGVLSPPILLKNQKKMEVKERDIVLLIGR